MPAGSLRRLGPPGRFGPTRTTGRWRVTDLRTLDEEEIATIWTEPSAPTTRLSTDDPDDDDGDADETDPGDSQDDDAGDDT